MKYIFTLMLFTLAVGTSSAQDYNKEDPNLKMNSSKETTEAAVAAAGAAPDTCCTDKATSVEMSSRTNPDPHSGSSKGSPVGTPETTR